ncbi:hypothetical protein GLYMA_13G146051v4 [Glycine max]|nr:hypothetical protein GLYMA_13G146051v4 [Glycine max]KAH1101539.1 hypothetical protein GYH30_036216 [Glycine max]
MLSCILFFLAVLAELFSLLFFLQEKIPSYPLVSCNRFYIYPLCSSFMIINTRKHFLLPRIQICYKCL